MNILIVNDDGIHAKGIRKLTELVKELGKVTVVAPKKQCSAMSQRITVMSEIDVEPVSYGLEGVTAYSVDGTPADCVKIALLYLCDEKPDLVLSGINEGFNVGFDIAYSGTVGATMEATMNGIRAVAFSNHFNNDYEVVDAYLVKILQELLQRDCGHNEVWNVNFPGCSVEECKGIQEVADAIGQTQFYQDGYEKVFDLENGGFRLAAKGVPVSETKEGTDMHAVLNHYISIGKVKSMVMR